MRTDTSKGRKVYCIAYRFPRGRVWYLDDRMFYHDLEDARADGEDWWGSGGYEFPWRVVVYEASEFNNECFECGEVDCKESCNCPACMDKR